MPVKTFDTSKFRFFATEEDVVAMEQEAEASGEPLYQLWVRFMGFDPRHLTPDEMGAVLEAREIEFELQKQNLPDITQEDINEMCREIEDSYKNNTHDEIMKHVNHVMYGRKGPPSG